MLVSLPGETKAFTAPLWLGSTCIEVLGIDCLALSGWLALLDGAPACLEVTGVELPDCLDISDVELSDCPEEWGIESLACPDLFELEELVCPMLVADGLARSRIEVLDRSNFPDLWVSTCREVLSELEVMERTGSPLPDTTQSDPAFMQSAYNAVENVKLEAIAKLIINLFM